MVLMIKNVVLGVMIISSTLFCAQELKRNVPCKLEFKDNSSKISNKNVSESRLEKIKYRLEKEEKSAIQGKKLHPQNKSNIVVTKVQNNTNSKKRIKFERVEVDHKGRIRKLP